MTITHDLFINSYGASLKVKNNMFSIRTLQTQILADGSSKPLKPYQYTTHSPIAAHKVHRIFLHTGTMVTVDAMQLALVNNIDIVLMDQLDEPLGRVWHTKLGSTTKIRKKQLEASLGEVGVYWVKKWLTSKLGNQMAMLEGLKKHRSSKAAYLSDKVQQIKALMTSVAALEGSQVATIAATLRGLEGTAGRLYFDTLSQVLAQEYQFKGRSQRPAKDAFNAFLNYGYGVLYSTVERALTIAGVEPFVGFMHRDGYNQLSMVYDFIEPYRVYVEKVVFKLFSAKKVKQSHTDALAQGVRLNAGGKTLLTEPLGDYLRNEKIKHGRRQQTRAQVIQNEAIAFAQSLLAASPASVAPLNKTDQ